MSAGSLFASWVHDSSVSGPGASVSGTPELAIAMARRPRRPSGRSCATTSGSGLPSAWFAGGAVIGTIQLTPRRCPMLGPSFAPGATATTGVTKPASRVPSGWRSSTSTGYTPVRRSCKRVDSRGAPSAWSGKVSVRLPSSSAGKGSSGSSAWPSTEPRFRPSSAASKPDRELTASCAVALTMRPGVPAARPRTWRRSGRLPPTVTQAGWPVSTRRRVRRGIGRRGRRVYAGADRQRTEHEDGSGRQHDDRGAPQSVRPSTHSPTGSRRKPHDS